jgi:hypothetical protein
MTMGDEMGMINDNGTEVDMGRKLVRGSWNAEVCPFDDHPSRRNLTNRILAIWPSF